MVGMVAIGVGQARQGVGARKTKTRGNSIPAGSLRDARDVYRLSPIAYRLSPIASSQKPRAHRPKARACYEVAKAGTALASMRHAKAR